MSILAAAEQDAKARKAPPKRAVPEDTQQTCIDLPGETVRCTVVKPKLEIILRKHRDVIFELQLFKGMTYTVEADQSDFYSARDKKLFEFKKKHKVTFKDGERMHLWVSRDFKGSLILKANGKLFGRYEPNKLDILKYDADPATKPAPLIVAIKNDPVASQPIASLPAVSNNSLTGPGSKFGIPSYEPLTFSQPKVNGNGAQSMHVVEVKPGKDMPQEVIDFFKHGGEQTALDSKGILTRNWLWIQIFGGLAYLGDNSPWIRDLWKEKFYLQKIKHKAGEKVYVVFKGSPGLRKFLTGTRYAADHAKVLAITAGAGSAAGLRHAAWDGAKGLAKKGGVLTVVFATLINIAEWLVDYEQRDPVTGKPKRDFFDLVFKIGVDIAKAVVSAAIGVLAMGSFVWLVTAGAAVFGLTAAFPAVVIILGTIAVSIFVGYLIDDKDKETGATENLNKIIRDSTSYLKQKLSADYSGYGDDMVNSFVTRNA